MGNVFSEKQQVLVTGGTRGIGLACARRFAQSGARVVVVGRNALGDVDLGDNAGRIDVWQYDLMDQRQLKCFLNRIDSENIMPDVVVHSIGGTLGVQESSPIEDWELVQRLNFQLPVEINKFLLGRNINQMKRILHISSSAAQHGQASLPYLCSKAALNAYVRTKGRELARSGLALCAIAPAAVEGDGGIWDRIKVTDPGRYEAVSRSQILGRLQSSDEIAAFVHWFSGVEGLLFAGQVLWADASV